LKYPHRYQFNNLNVNQFKNSPNFLINLVPGNFLHGTHLLRNFGHPNLISNQFHQVFIFLGLGNPPGTHLLRNLSHSDLISNQFHQVFIFLGLNLIYRILKLKII